MAVIQWNGGVKGGLKEQGRDFTHGEDRVREGEVE
jgi:hypothetical protein